jgi:hypothetical protein
MVEGDVTLKAGAHSGHGWKTSELLEHADEGDILMVSRLFVVRRNPVGVGDFWRVYPG